MLKETADKIATLFYQLGSLPPFFLCLSSLQLWNHEEKNCKMPGTTVFQVELESEHSTPIHKKIITWPILHHQECKEHDSSHRGRSSLLCIWNTQWKMSQLTKWTLTIHLVHSLSEIQEKVNSFMDICPSQVQCMFNTHAFLPSLVKHCLCHVYWSI